MDTTGKRRRTLTKKRQEMPVSPPTQNEESGYFAFVHFEDDATATIFKPSSILVGSNESPVLRLLDLKTGQNVLAKWSDGKFYKATVEYVSQTETPVRKTPKQTPKQAFINQFLGSQHVSASSSGSSPDTIIIQRSPLPEFGEEISPGPLTSPHLASRDGRSPHGAGALARRSPPSSHRASGGGPSLNWASGVSPPSHGASRVSPPSHGASGVSPPSHGASGVSPPSHGASGVSPPSHGASGVSPPSHGASGVSPPSHGASGVSPPSHGASGVSPPSHGASGVSPPSHGASRVSPPSHGASGVSPPSHGASGVSPPSHGASGVSPPSHGASGVSPPSHGASGYGYSTQGAGASGLGPDWGSRLGPSDWRNTPLYYGVHAALETAYGETGTCASAYSVGAAGPLPYGPSPDGGHASDPPPGDGNPAGRKAASPLHYWRELGSSPDQSNVPTATEWTPCDGCKKEFDKLICQKREVDEVASKIDPGQLQEIQNLINLIGQSHRDQESDSTNPSATSGHQELFPDSGLFVSSFRLAAMHQSARQDSMRLFHSLFDHFFTVEECQKSVAFGRHGKPPEGKKLLERKKVDGILTYVLRCATIPGWTKIDDSKLKKAFINKCRARAGENSSRPECTP
ncbi:mucin-1-like [Gadus chalcogrammus]|uniref:mucin-1-like n=1 Tax=Gadus chalcogrammus TaxID=1042646 RepID=UPI0024C4745B|nr:mucin-1-like [Gadus chalcogrammus]XP_056462773.1 mucin-1-like [Gadus chalcogrammus]